MAKEKLFTAKEAAQAVLAKTQELLAKAALVKAPAEKDQTGAQGVQPQAAPQNNPAEIKENGNPAPGALPQNQEKFGAEKKDLKGHLKLAKFVGRMEAKRSAPKAAVPGTPPMAKAETGHEKGVHSGNFSDNAGHSDAGLSVRHAGNKELSGANRASGIASAKEDHKRVLGEMKSMPKPKLGKAEGATDHAGEMAHHYGKMMATHAEHGGFHPDIAKHSVKLKEHHDALTASHGQEHADKTLKSIQVAHKEKTTPKAGESLGSFQGRQKKGG